MSILEDNDLWAKTFREGWLAQFQHTGKLDWDTYNRPRNQTSIAGPGVDLSSSRLMLISSAGGYLPASQQPFDAANPLGDYAIRLFPYTTPLADLAYAHDHYDHAAVDADPQVLLPLGHLNDMVGEGKIGTLTSIVSFMGYQPDVSRLLDETIPAIVMAAQNEKVDAAILVPS